MSTATINIIYLVFVQAMIYLSPLITLPYLTRVLQVEQFAALSFVQIFIQYFIFVTDYGFGITVTRLITLWRHDWERISEIVINTLAVKLILAILMAGVCLSMLFLIPSLRGSEWLIAAAFIGVFSNALFPTWLFQGLERMKQLAFITGFSRLAVLPLIFLFVKSPGDVVLAAALMSTPGLIASLMSYFYFRKLKTLIWAPVSARRMFELLREGWPVFASNISISLYTMVNLTVLKFLGTSEQVAFFAASDKIRSGIQGFISPIASALFPRFVAFGSSPKPEEFRRLNRLGWCSLVGTQIIGAAFIFFGADFIAINYFGEAFAGVAIYLKAFAVLPVIIAVATIFSQWRLLALGEGLVLSRIYVIAGPLHIVYAIAATYYWGWIGLLSSVYLTEIMVTFAMYCVIRNKRIQIF